MKVVLHKQMPKFYYLLTSLFLFLSLQAFANGKCGKIKNVEFSNGHETVQLMDGGVYSVSDLPINFYVETKVTKKVKSVRYIVENLDTGKTYKILENYRPFTFPAGNRPWNLGTGNFRLTTKIYKFRFGKVKCGSKSVMFTITPPCTADAGTLTADATTATLAGGEATISASPNGDINVPEGYSSLFVLTSSENLVIEQVGDSPEFTVSAAGLYTIHTLVYDGNASSANFLDLGVVEFGVTTGVDVLNLIKSAGICASLDAAGAPVTVEEGEACLADAGTMYSSSPITCFGGGPSTIQAQSYEPENVPSGYSQLFVLTEGFTLTILAVSNEPVFEVDKPGFYRIHSLVYNPDTLDLGVVEFGVTTGFDVVNLVTENSICASLDVHGAINIVIRSKWLCKYLSRIFNRKSYGMSSEDLPSNLNAILSDDGAGEFNNNKIKLFPNPVLNNLNISMASLDDEIFDFTITDVSGRRVKSGKLEYLNKGYETITTENLGKGIYLIQLNSKYRQITKKIVINK